MATFKEALFENLIGILSDDVNLRNNAEQQIKLIEVTNNYGVYLTEIALDSSIDWPIRQLAAVLLKRYIETHWTRNREKFEEPEVPRDDKSRIRGMLISALGEPAQNSLTENSPEKKLRTSIAHAISTIANCDWPEEWSDLFNILIKYISSGNNSIVYGTMKVFSEICHEITDTQIPKVAPVLVPKMYEVFVNKQAFSIGTRGRAVQIFSIIAETVLLMEQFDKNAVGNFLDPYLPEFTEALLKSLEDPDTDILLKKNILSALAVLVKNSRKRIWQWMPQILTPVWNIMTSSATGYVNQMVNTEIKNGANNNPAVDSDGEEISLGGLVLTVFDFISSIIESPKLRKLIKQGISDLLYYTIVYMQITDAQIEQWVSNPDQFVEEEDEDSFAYGVRTSGLEIILLLAKEVEDSKNPEDNLEFQAAFMQALQRHFEESNRAHQQGDPNWWKAQEASLTALGSLSQYFTEHTSDEQNQFNYQIKRILDHVFCNRDESLIFYAGRSLWAAARYAPIMNENMIQNFLRSISGGFQSTSPIIQICALRSAYNICVHLLEVKKEELIKPYLEEFLDAAIRISKEHEAEVLKLCLDTIAVLIPMDSNFASASLDRLIPILMNTFTECASDPLMLDVCEEIFKELFKNEQCHKQCGLKLLPSLVDILQQPSSNREVHHLKPNALDIITSFVRHSPLPLPIQILAHCFPLVCHTVLSNSDESSIMQNGGEAVRAFVSRAPQQVAQFKDPQSGLDGMSLVMRVCMHLLDPRLDESCGTFVGKLIFVTIHKGSEYLGNEKVHLLLRSVLSKLQTSETLSVIQNLIMVFAHLINHNLQTVLDFLGSLPGPSGSQSALEFVLTNWLNRQHSFFGNYENKVTMLALCKLFEHSIVSSANNQQNLNQIMVIGDPIISSEDGVRTRSRCNAKPDQWTMIPCSVKILKLLLHELDHIQNGEDCEEEDDDESDDECDDTNNSNGFGGNDSMFNRSFNPSDIEELIEDNAEDDEDDEDDPDVQEDPISKVNLEHHLTNFLRQFMATPCADEFTSQLDDYERSLLSKVANHNSAMA